jgi:peptide/nickel transport system permease protein
MRGIDTLMAFPYLLLALAIVAVLGPGLLNALMAIAVVNIPFFARAVRGQALSILNLDYIAAARLSGFSDARIILGEILPNVFPVVVVTMSTISPIPCSCSVATSDSNSSCVPSSGFRRV